MKITSILLFILLLSNAAISSAEEADPRVGKAVFNLYPITIHDQPAFQGMIVEEATTGTNFIVLSVENGWYKVKTIRGAIGYAAIDWVTEDIKVIEEKKAEETKQIAQEEKKRKEKSLEEEKQKKERLLEEEREKKERSFPRSTATY